MAIVSVDMGLVDFESGSESQTPYLRLIVTDTDGSKYRLEIEGQALGEFAEIFRNLQGRFPSALGVH